VQVWQVPHSRRAVIYLHGTGQDEQLLNGPQAPTIVRLHNEGWIVAADAAHGDAWGNAESVADYKALVHELKTRYGATQVVLLAASMGGLPALHLLRDRVATTLVAVSPVTNLASILAIPAAVASIDAALGSTPPSGSDPETWPRRALRRDDVTVIASPADPTVPFTTNAQLFAAKFGAHLLRCTGGHVDPSCFAKVSFAAS
jgi:alpha-beta hydrolase superfamily lysophospholipase